MMPMRFAFAISTLAAAISTSTAMARAADFYAGKRITIVINYAAGGPSDVEGRLFAKHLPKHIPGNPTVLVQNMDGAAGAVGANYIGEIAPKDGTFIGLLTASAWTFALESGKSRVDYNTYEFIAAQPSTTVYYMRTDVKPGIKTPADLGKAEGLIVGGLGADSTKDIMLRLTLDMLGHKYKYVTGYRGSNAARLAFQQGEINVYSESPPSYRSMVEPGLVAKGDAIGVFYDPGWDGKTFSKSKQVEGLPMKSYPELYKEIRGTLPSGRLWETYLQLLTLSGSLFRIAVMPPGTPKAAVETIRVAIDALAKDRDYAEESMKAFGYEPEIDASAGLGDRIKPQIKISPELRSFVLDYIKAANEHK